MVKTEIKKLSSSKRELKVTLPKGKVDEIREDQAKKIRKEAQVPGFRKGKAPLGMVKKRYASLIEAYSLEKAVEKSLELASEQENLEILGTPEAKEVNFDDDGNLVSQIEFETYPEIELKKYKGIELIRDKYVITDQLVENNIQQLLKERAEISSSDGPVAEGNLVKVDMQELDESGVPVVGRKYEDVEFKVGEGRFDKEIELQLVGAKKGETKRVEKVYPEDFPQKEFAGKKELYDITVKEISIETLPELNDEFVQELGDESLKTVEDLKKRIRENLERRYEDESEARLEDDLIQTLLSENEFDVPKAMVDNYLNSLVRNAKIQFPDAREEDLRKAYQANAETMVKWYYFMEKVAEAENIEVTDEEIDKLLEETVVKEEDRKKIKENPNQMLRIKDDLFYEKVKNFLLEQAEIKENEIVLD
ncbi:MAG: trigger factor [Caldisericaceae bacterium]|nr:trigger factor [Caldisericaceae bacterium]